MRCMTACATGTHLGTRSAHSGSNSCKDSNLDWYSTVAAGLRLEPSVFQKHFPAAALHLSVWTFSLYGVSLSFNHAPALRKLRWTSAEFRLMKDKTHRRPHIHAEGVRHSGPPAGGIITARSREANHKLALTWPKGCWEILSSFLHLFPCLNTLSAALAECHVMVSHLVRKRCRKSQRGGLTMPHPMICLYQEMSF